MKKRAILIGLLIVIIIVGLSISVYFVSTDKNEEKDTSSAENLVSLEDSLQNSNNIHYNFSDISVKDMNSAKEALYDVQDELQISSIKDDLIEDKEDTLGDYFNTYRFNQNFKGFEVYNSGLIVYADKSGEAEGVINDYKVIPESFNIVPQNKADDLKNVALNFFNDELSYDIEKISESKLIIFPVTDEKFTLAYKYSIDTDFGTEFAIVSDETEEILTYHILGDFANYVFDNEAKVLAKSIGYKDEDFTDIGKYALIDKDKKIVVSKYISSEEVTLYNWDEEISYNENEKTLDTNSQDYKDNSLGFKTLATVQKVYDYYIDKFELYLHNGKVLEIITGYKELNGDDISNNAIYLSGSYILLGADNIYNESVEVIGHEMTHGTFRYFINIDERLEECAINEAYADIMGMCIEAYYNNNDKIDGEIKLKGGKRNIKGSKLKCKDFPVVIPDNWRHSEKDDHYYSTIISKLAYQMNDFLTVDQIEQLWFNSMRLLPDSPRFIDVYAAVSVAANNLRFSNDEQQKIAKLFAEAGILEERNSGSKTHESSSGSSSGGNSKNFDESSSKETTIEDSVNKTKENDVDTLDKVEKDVFNKQFTSFEGKNKSATNVKELLNKIVLNNSGESKLVIKVEFGAENYENSEIASLKNKVTNNQKYEISFKYSKDGFIENAIIKNSASSENNKNRKDVEYDGGVMIEGSTYVDGDFKYVYLEKDNTSHLEKLDEDGWRVILNDEDVREIKTTPCTSIGGKPIVSLRHTFGYSKLKTIDMTGFDTSHVVDMEELFMCSNVENIIGLDTIDTSKVKTMYYMFYKCPAKEIDVSHFDTSNVKDFGHMFNGCKAIKLDTSNFVVSEDAVIDSMFSNTEIAEVDISGFDFKEKHEKNLQWASSYMFSNSGTSKVYVKDETAKAFFEKIQQSTSDEKFKAIEFIVK